MKKTFLLKNERIFGRKIFKHEKNVFLKYIHETGKNHCGKYGNYW